MYSEEQKEVFLRFCKECQGKRIDPTRSEAEKQRALLLAKENRDLVRIFGDELDQHHVDAYRLGKEFLAEKAAVKNKAEREATIAKYRELDERSFTAEQSMSKAFGRQKRLRFYSYSVDRALEEVSAANTEERNIALMWDSMNKQDIKDNDGNWGLKGGIAAGITGSTAVGAVVAANAMNQNGGHKSVEEIKRSNLKQLDPMLNAVQAGRRKAREKAEKLQKEADKVKLHLTEERPVEDLMKGLSIGEPQIAFTYGNTMTVRVKINATEQYQIAGGIPAVIDGCFLAEIYEGDQLIGCAYLNLPRDGLKETSTVKGHCLEAKLGVDYTVVILPLALWLIEENPELAVEIADLDQIIGIDKYCRVWTPISLYKVTWQQRIEERQREAERKAEAERIATAKRKARNKKLGIIAGAVAVIGIVAAVVVTQVVIPGNKYKAAEALLADGEHEQAIAAFEELGGFKDAPKRISEIYYAEAEQLLAEQKITPAAMRFRMAGDYQDAQERSIALLQGTNRETLSGGYELVVAVKSDGTVVATGDNDYGQCNVEDWTDIVAVSAAWFHTVGLKSDGTVVATGNNDRGQCNVSDWTDIVAVAAGHVYTVGLKADGTVVATGSYEGSDTLAVEDWTDVVAVSLYSDHVVGLRADGTVVATGDNDSGQCNVYDWTDIVAVAAGSGYTVGIKADGTAVAVGDDDFVRYSLDKFGDCVTINAAYDMIGVKSDGTVVASEGDIENDVNWADVVAATVGDDIFAGLKPDGTVVFTCIFEMDREEVDREFQELNNWTDIKLPSHLPGSN